MPVSAANRINRGRGCAIRGKVLRGFLEKNRVDFTATRKTAKLENIEIASQGVAVTVLRCSRRRVTVTPVAG